MIVQQLTLEPYERDHTTNPPPLFTYLSPYLSFYDCPTANAGALRA